MPDPLIETLTIISADSHVQEPPELYEERLPEKFRHRAPRIEEREDGSVYCIVDGKRPRRLDLAEPFLSLSICLPSFSMNAP